MPRSVGFAALLALPFAGFTLLLVAPELDGDWHHHPVHFWLVLLSAAVNAALAYALSEAARRRSDVRLALVALAFLAAGGFLGLHALATPRVLVDGPNVGFVVAAPVGLLVAGAFAAASALDLSSAASRLVLRRLRLLRALLLAAMGLWALASLAELPPFDGRVPAKEADGPLVPAAIVGIVGYGFAAARYLRLLRQRPSRLLGATVAGWVLLAEAIVATAFARNWHVTWWEWHVLMLTAFVLVAEAARREWRDERFSALYTDDTAAGRRDVSVLFADLAGFTAFAERAGSGEVSAMLNAYFQATIPKVVREHGAVVDKLVGDSVMLTFNTRGDQPDHARRAAAAALQFQGATGRLAAQHPHWPRFRVGVNSGWALVGVLGADGGRSYTVIGDAVNVAARLESEAPPGAVVIGGATRDRLDGATVEPLGPVVVKGREAPVDAYLLLALADASPSPSAMVALGGRRF